MTRFNHIRVNVRRGFSLIELLVSVGIIAVVASMIVPMLSDQDRVRLMAASAILTSDIELAQSLSIAEAANGHGVHFDAANQRWWISRNKSTGTPIVRDDTQQDYLVILGVGRARAAEGVTFSIDQITGDHLGFDSRGGLTAFAAQPAITFSVGSQRIKLSVNPNTGTVTETFGTDAPKSK